MDANLDKLSKAKQLFLDALSMQEAGDLAGAEQSFRGALLLAPGRESILTNLSGLLLAQHRFLEAREFCECAIRGNATSPEAWFNAALCNLGQGRLEDAERQLNRY